MADWQPIETAPKDGRVILVMAEDAGAFSMAWNPVATNEHFAPGQVGLWEMFDRTATWAPGEFGPTHWQPLPEPPGA